MIGGIRDGNPSAILAADIPAHGGALSSGCLVSVEEARRAALLYHLATGYSPAGWRRTCEADIADRTRMPIRRLAVTGAKNTTWLPAWRWLRRGCGGYSAAEVFSALRLPAKP